MQLRELRAYARGRRLTVVEEFIDRVSSTKNERTQLERLWRQVRARKIDTVLVLEIRSLCPLDQATH